MPRKKLEVVSYIRNPNGNGELILFDDLTPEQLKEWRIRTAQRLSRVMSEHFNKRPEELVKYFETHPQVKWDGVWG